MVVVYRAGEEGLPLEQGSVSPRRLKRVPHGIIPGLWQGVGDGSRDRQQSHGFAGALGPMQTAWKCGQMLPTWVCLWRCGLPAWASYESWGRTQRPSRAGMGRCTMNRRKDYWVRSTATSDSAYTGGHHSMGGVHCSQCHQEQRRGVAWEAVGMLCPVGSSAILSELTSVVQLSPCSFLCIVPVQSDGPSLANDEQEGGHVTTLDQQANRTGAISCRLLGRQCPCLCLRIFGEAPCWSLTSPNLLHHWLGEGEEEAKSLELPCCVCLIM